MSFVVGESRPHHNKIGASIIMAAEGIDHSHLYVSWKDHLGLRWVAEARGGGVQVLSNVEFKLTNKIVNVYKYSLPDLGQAAAIKWIWENLPAHYGYKQIYGLSEMRALNMIARQAGSTKRFSNRFRDGEFSQICCEFAIRAICHGLSMPVPKDVECWGLRETRQFNLLHGTMVGPDEIFRINQPRPMP
jgi:hypothetical protein